jgi:hypothetical protein
MLQDSKFFLHWTNLHQISRYSMSMQQAFQRELQGTVPRNHHPKSARKRQQRNRKRNHHQHQQRWKGSVLQRHLRRNRNLMDRIQILMVSLHYQCCVTMYVHVHGCVCMYMHAQETLVCTFASRCMWTRRYIHVYACEPMRKRASKCMHAPWCAFKKLVLRKNNLRKTYICWKSSLDHKIIAIWHILLAHSSLVSPSFSCTSETDAMLKHWVKSLSSTSVIAHVIYAICEGEQILKILKLCHFTCKWHRRTRTHTHEFIQRNFK